jgi:hypothetical protein
MDNIKNTAAILLSQSRDFWVVEWWLSEDCGRRFNVDTLDKHIERSANGLANSKKPIYHLLAIVESQEAAAEAIEDFKIICKIDQDELIEEE